jgi:two-component system NtrC family sensor kinase
MGAKKNCWEAMDCHKDDCPAKNEERLDGVHGGIAAGRACWVVAGTRCRGEVQGEYAQKFQNCSTCKFYLQVREEEGGLLRSGMVLLSMIGKDADITT